MVILRAGRHSVHPQWTPGIAAFDLIVFGYEDLPAELTVTARETIIRPGPKIAAWAWLFATRPDLLETYQQIALLDDDLVCSIDDINKAFAAGRKHDLWLWQPSLSWDSFFTYGATLNNPLFALRYVNFIELMCPFFAASQLQCILPLLSLGYEVYIDRLWCRIKETSNRRYAVLDDIQFKHSRPVGKNAEAQGFSSLTKTKNGGMYQSAIDQIEIDLAVQFRGAVAYAGITRGGRLVQGRLVMALTTLIVLRGWGRHVENKFIRPMLDHARHNLTRPIANDPITIDQPNNGVDI